jgi:hypothetical protein
VSDIVRYAARYRPTLELQLISVVGRVRPAGSSRWLSDDDIVRYYAAVCDALSAVAPEARRIRWKFNRYQFNPTMHDYQAELRMDHSTFDRIVERIKAYAAPILSPQAQVTISSREDYGYLFIRSDGMILTMRSHDGEEAFIDLGSFMIGSVRHPEIWREIPSGVIRQAISVKRQDMLAEALRYEAGIRPHTAALEATRRLERLRRIISESLFSGRAPTELNHALVDQASLDVIDDMTHASISEPGAR